MIGFVKVRQTWFPVDAIDQVDDIPGKVIISLATGQKIVLDPAEGEKVCRQLESQSSVPPPEPASSGILSRMVAIESQVMALKAQVAAIAQQTTTIPAPARAKAKANA